MKILATLGSPRKKGNTATLLNAFLKGTNDRAGAEVEFVYLQEKDIQPCKSCQSCRRSPFLKCAINDDMQRVNRAC
ncbi:MAG: flavodoxin family protein [Thermoanaerobacterales bacterium]|jgi:multimeric flavodoxin WrbA|nr:flavodoxin family protein [Thermoanaerobacterales bacterium]